MGNLTTEWKGTEYFSIGGFNHIEFFVGNAKQAVHFYRSIFGFQPHAYSGPETGNKKCVSYVLKNNKIFFILTTPLSSKHYASKWLDKHEKRLKSNLIKRLGDVNINVEICDKIEKSWAGKFRVIKSKVNLI